MNLIYERAIQGLKNLEFYIVQKTLSQSGSISVIYSHANKKGFVKITTTQIDGARNEVHSANNSLL